MVAPEEFLRVYKEVLDESEPGLELMDFVRKVALHLVVDKTMALIKLKSVLGSSDAIRYVEEMYLHSVIETTMRCMKQNDPFFEKLEKEMKEK